MRFPDLLTAGERRLVLLLFTLAAAGLLTRGGSRLSPAVEAWLADPFAGASGFSRPAEGVGGTSVPAIPDSSPAGESFESPEGPESPREEPGTPDPGGRPGGGAAAEGLVDPNRDDAAALMALPGIGPALAKRILEDRARNGPYASPADLLRVSGIGPATLARIEGRLAFPP